MINQRSIRQRKFKWITRQSSGEPTYSLMFRTSLDNRLGLHTYSHNTSFYSVPGSVFNYACQFYSHYDESHSLSIVINPVCCYDLAMTLCSRYRECMESEPNRDIYDVVGYLTEPLKLCKPMSIPCHYDNHCLCLSPDTRGTNCEFRPWWDDTLPFLDNLQRSYGIPSTLPSPLGPDVARLPDLSSNGVPSHLAIRESPWLPGQLEGCLDIRVGTPGFPRDYVPAGTHIGIYGGELVSWGTYTDRYCMGTDGTYHPKGDHRHHSGGYEFNSFLLKCHIRGGYIDGSYGRYAAAFINDPLGEYEVNCATEVHRGTGEVHIVTTRRIDNGGTLWLRYGWEYWKSMGKYSLRKKAFRDYYTFPMDKEKVDWVREWNEAFPGEDLPEYMTV